MHTLLDLRGNIPSFIHISDGKLHDVHALDLLLPELGAIVPSASTDDGTSSRTFSAASGIGNTSLRATISSLATSLPPLISSAHSITLSCESRP